MRLQNRGGTVMNMELQLNPVDASALDFLLEKIAKYNKFYGKIENIIIDKDGIYCKTSDVSQDVQEKRAFTVYSLDLDDYLKVTKRVKVAEVTLSGAIDEFKSYVASNFLNIPKQASISIESTEPNTFFATIDGYPCCEFLMN